MKWRPAAIGLAIVLGVAPLPAATIEHYYSNLLYPAWQRTVTAVSNLVPIALFDVLLAGAIAWLVVVGGRTIARRRREGLRRATFALVAQIATVASILYIVFLITWGLNYRRLPLTEKLPYDASAVSASGALELAHAAVREANALHDRARGEIVAGIDPELAAAFADAQRALGVTRLARAARPKWTIVDFYFEAAGVDGMTDPFFLETLVPDDLLPFERPFVIAHEWSHLAGFADEGEANFVGWLICTRGSDLARYSGWLFLYSQVLGSVSQNDRPGVMAALAPGPRADLRAIADRVRREVKPLVADAGWLAYDRYLKANRIEAGTASYAEVVRLVLGVRLGPT